MLLYLTKYSRPNLCNVVRELSKCMDKATMDTYLEMLRVIKFVITPKISVTEFNPNQNSKIGVAAYFVTVIGREILKLESV
jgi:hypothetical protein